MAIAKGMHPQNQRKPNNSSPYYCLHYQPRF
jgi:hypothetical protein